MNKEELIRRIQRICTNDQMDMMSQENWDAEVLTVEQLRTIVSLLNDGTIQQIVEDGRLRGRREDNTCFFLEDIVRYLDTSVGQRNPINGRVISPRQRQLLIDAYQRMIASATSASASTRPRPSTSTSTSTRPRPSASASTRRRPQTRNPYYDTAQEIYRLAQQQVQVAENGYQVALMMWEEMQDDETYEVVRLAHNALQDMREQERNARERRAFFE